MRKSYPWNEWLRIGSRIINRDQFGAAKTESIRRQFYTRAAEYDRKVHVSIAKTWIRVTVTEEGWIEAQDPGGKNETVDDDDEYDSCRGC